MKTILITGAGRGLGRATAIRLANLGHRVIVTARNAAASEHTVAKIRAENPNAQVEARALDLSSFENVRSFGDAWASQGSALDVLFHCAGVMQQSPTRRTTVDGLEETLAVNVLAPFLLTRLVFPSLAKAPSARVINVSSRMHLPGSRGAPVDFDFDDPNLARGYNHDRAYKNSKLALLWFTYELQRRLGPRPVKANAVCPGFVPETAAVSTHGFQAWLLRNVLVHFPFARTVDEAVDSFTFMALDPSLNTVGGRFFGEMKQLESSPESHDTAKAKRFWDYAAGTTGTGAWP